MDARTLLVCAVSLLLVYSITLLLAHLHQRNADGAGWMSAAYGSAAVGAGLGAAQGYISHSLAIVAAGGFLVLGHLLQRRAICQFVGVQVPRRALVAETAILAASVGGLVYWTYSAPHSGMRMLMISLAPAFLAAYSASLLLRVKHDPDASRSEHALGWVVAGLSGLLFLRSIVAVRGGPEVGLFIEGGHQAAGILIAMLIGTAILLAFLWGIGARRHVALNRVAQLDPLTGLLNRRGFDRVAAMRIDEAARNRSEILLFAADMDDLKQVNDLFGHDVGDLAICEAAAVLRDILRASDCLARVGGDEFCAVVPVRNVADGEVILRRLQQRVAVQNAQPDRLYTIGITAAVLPFGDDISRPLPDLLREVDQRMYEVKRERKAVA